MKLVPGTHLYYPGLGVSEVLGIQSIELEGTVHEMLVMKTLVKDLTVRVPKTRLDALGVRPVLTKTHLSGMLKTLRNPTPIPGKKATWNRRFRRYTEQLLTGVPAAICEVLAELYQIRTRKGALSFGERRMYDKIHETFATEIAVVKGISTDEAAALLDENLDAGVQSLKAA